MGIEIIFNVLDIKKSFKRFKILLVNNNISPNLFISL